MCWKYDNFSGPGWDLIECPDTFSECITPYRVCVTYENGVAKVISIQNGNPTAYGTPGCSLNDPGLPPDGEESECWQPWPCQ